MTQRLHGLYAIADTGVLSEDALVPAVSAAIRGGARIVQYRDKSGDAARRREQTRALVRCCRDEGALALINDDLDLALAVAADGVHLGGDDGDLREARRALGPDRILGASCYNRVALAEAAAAAGADYAAFGSFFPSPTKPDAVRATPALLTEARKIGLPLCAIGGITAENAGPLIAAGADMVAVIHGVFGKPDPEAAARRFAAFFA